MGSLEALRVISRHDGRCRVQEVREELEITVGAASKIVDRLERSGLAARKPNPADRRSSLIVLTGKGRRAHEQGVALIEAELDRVLSGIAPHERTLVEDVLGRLTVALAQVEVAA
jgi:DNA-binding MarR family transcriptional regulator